MIEGEKSSNDEEYRIVDETNTDIDDTIGYRQTGNSDEALTEIVKKKYSGNLIPWTPISHKYWYESTLIGISQTSAFDNTANRISSILTRRRTSSQYADESIDGGNTFRDCYVNANWYYASFGYLCRANGERHVFGNQTGGVGNCIGIFSSAWTLLAAVARPAETDGTLVTNMMGFNWDEAATGTIIIAHYNIDTCQNSSLWRSTDGGRTYTKCLSKRAKGNVSPEIRHWHDIQCDPYTGYWWAASGDSDAESMIVISADDGATWIEAYHGGNARVINFVFTATKVYWGTEDNAQRAGNFCIYTKPAGAPVPITDADLTAIEYPNIIANTALSPYGILIYGRMENTVVKGDKNNIYVGIYDFYTQKIHYVLKMPVTTGGTRGFGFYNPIYPIAGKYLVNICNSHNFPVVSTLYDVTKTPGIFELQLKRNIP
ncbi:MAG TPA: hypothetical protein VHT96_11050 [Clostridia bacterium]|nr:hypothetical protein [Clostridia bacterium]